MKYVLFVCLPESDEVTRPGEGLTARLRPPDDATTVRARDDEVLLSDGPFARGKEYVAGLDLVEAADLDEAVALAARHSAALGGGPVEVRPVWD
ncbi:YciI family protein [Streptomyces sp. YU58]|uniref:YciI family protein n=1 Tax=Streptomyces sp. SX92 TaxID=3158972 RepID=UPI0027BAFADE|nr:YciI family protein [Streptomyces coralus]WLW57501.1 YciI family protein [Streptomyces coralus]